MPMPEAPLTPDEFAEVLLSRGIDGRTVSEVVDCYHAHVVAAHVGGSA
jgi:hypothetical protein